MRSPTTNKQGIIYYFTSPRQSREGTFTTIMARDHARVILLFMDELCSAAKQYVDILKLCSSPEVKSWRKEDLSRALQWCKYFNEVCISPACLHN